MVSVADLGIVGLIHEFQSFSGMSWLDQPLTHHERAFWKKAHLRHLNSFSKNIYASGLVYYYAWHRAYCRPRCRHGGACWSRLILYSPISFSLSFHSLTKAETQFNVHVLSGEQDVAEKDLFVSSLPPPFFLLGVMKGLFGSLLPILDVFLVWLMWFFALVRCHSLFISHLGGTSAMWDYLHQHPQACTSASLCVFIPRFYRQSLRMGSQTGIKRRSTSSRQPPTTLKASSGMKSAWPTSSIRENTFVSHWL